MVTSYATARQSLRRRVARNGQARRSPRGVVCRREPLKNVKPLVKRVGAPAIQQRTSPCGVRSAKRRPSVAVLLMLGLMALLSIEGSLCLPMALPLFLILAGIGGCLGLATRRHTAGSARAGGISM